MALIKTLLENPPSLTSASKYTTFNGFVYLVVGLLLIVGLASPRPSLGTLPLSGMRKGTMRVIGLTVVVIGWLYAFGGRSQAQQIVAASVIDRLVFVPAVLIPVAMAACFRIYF